MTNEEVIKISKELIRDLEETVNVFSKLHVNGIPLKEGISLIFTSIHAFYFRHITVMLQMTSGEGKELIKDIIKKELKDLENKNY